MVENTANLKKNITKITQILQSENCEAGFELLKTLNQPKLNEALADSIKSFIYKNYFEGKSLEQMNFSKYFQQLSPPSKCLKNQQ